MGLDRGAELMGDSSRLMSFLALRKLDDLLRSTKPNKDDLIASDLGIDAPSVLSDVGEALLTKDERDKINKGVAHLTEHLTLDPDAEVDRAVILKRSIPVLSRLVVKLRYADAKKEAAHWLDKTAALIARVQAADEPALAGTDSGA